MNDTPPLLPEFDAWLDRALSEAIPPGVIAFCFNLAERARGPWCIEVVGSDHYSEDDSDWACEEVFRPCTESLSLTRTEAGETWEDALDYTKRLIAAFLVRPSSGSAVLQRAEAVAVGFSDGDLQKVFPE